MLHDPTATLQAEHIYLCIDLKSFYASVECVERGLDPMRAKLVVADPERTGNTICLAITPAMKSMGIKNRCRVHDIPAGVDYIMAQPRMQLYIDYAAEIYGIYLQYLAPDDIHVYSIDEAFLDVTHYLKLYRMTAKQLAQDIMRVIMQRTGVCATCGIGTNLYLAKIALDILAKHAPDCIAFLSEETYRATLWRHTPLTDFWRIGSGTANRLHKYGITTMEQIAKADDRWLRRLFGVDAELLVDHAWGVEPTTIADIKRYHGKTTSIGSGQVLMRDYSFDEARLIVKEMMDLLCLDLADRGVVTASVTLHVGYSHERDVKSAHGTARIAQESNVDSVWIPEVVQLYERIVRRGIPIRRINLTCNRVIPEQEVAGAQCSLFDTPPRQQRSHALQKTILQIKKQYGKNAILKGMNLEEAATTRERNHQIGGHKSGT